MKSKIVLERLILIMILVVLSQGVTISFAEKTMDLQKIIALAQKNSDAINMVKLDLVKKSIEKKQAEEGLADIRYKESTIRFSLLFDIKFPEKHGMPKEIDLLLKIPKIENEINKLNKKFIFEVSKLTFEIKSLYYGLLEKEAILNYEKNRVSDLELIYQKMYKNYLKGSANKEDLDLIEKKLKASKEKLIKVTLEFENIKYKISDLIGLDLTQGYAFTNELIETTFDRTDLNRFMDYGLANDYQVYVATVDRSMAEKEVTEIFGIYKNQFGTKTNIIAGEIDKDKIDYAELTRRYEIMLQDIDAKWQEKFVINLLFFEIVIPMEWFEGEYTALRYFEDEKYPLMVALGERDKKRTAEKEVIQMTKQKIAESYDAVKQCNLLVKQTNDLVPLAFADYEKAMKDNLLGKESFEKVEQAKEALLALELSAFQNQVAYSKFISMLDFNTSGAVASKLSGAGYVGGSYDSGISIMEKEASKDVTKDEATWFIETPYEKYKFIFGIKVPKTLQITHYQLFDNKGVPIASKLPVTEKLVHLPLAFSDPMDLKVILYTKEVAVYSSVISGDAYQGKLKLVKIDPRPQQLTPSIGSFEIVDQGTFKSTLTINVDPAIVYDSYQITDINNQFITSVIKKGESVEALTVIMQDVSNMKINLIIDKTIVRTLKPYMEGNSKKGILMNESEKK